MTKYSKQQKVEKRTSKNKNKRDAAAAAAAVKREPKRETPIASLFERVIHTYTDTYTTNGFRGGVGNRHEKARAHEGGAEIKKKINVNRKLAIKQNWICTKIVFHMQAENCMGHFGKTPQIGFRLVWVIAVLLIVTKYVRYSRVFFSHPMTLGSPLRTPARPPAFDLWLPPTLFGFSC